MSPPLPAGKQYDRSIVEGPLAPAVWRLAWPTMLQNIIGGMQGVVDHAMVGHYVGYTANAAIGVSLQLFLVVVVFISSLFTGMSVLVARHAGAGDREQVNRTVYQAFLTAMALSLGVLAPIGYLLAPTLLSIVNAAPEVQREALPYLRIMFGTSFGTLVFFMLGGALRAAGDARTPLRIGAIVTLCNIGFNVLFIKGAGPIPAMGTAGAALGTALATGGAAIWSLVQLKRGAWVVHFPHAGPWGPDWTIIRSLFRFGLPAGMQGIAMNIGGVLLLGFIGSLALSAEAQAAYAVAYTEIFSLITWTSVGLMGAIATVTGQNLGAGHADRAEAAVHLGGRIAGLGALTIGLTFMVAPRLLLAAFGMAEPVVLTLGAQLLRVLSVSGVFIAVALAYTGGLQGSGDTKGPLYISLVSQLALPLSICFIVQQTIGLEPLWIWLAILAGHVTRCSLSVWRFRQGHWRHIRL